MPAAESPARSATSPASSLSWLEPVLSASSPDDPPTLSPDATDTAPVTCCIVAPSPSADLTDTSPLVSLALAPDSRVTAPPRPLDSLDPPRREALPPSPPSLPAARPAPSSSPPPVPRPLEPTITCTEPAVLDEEAPLPNATLPEASASAGAPLEMLTSPLAAPTADDALSSPLSGPAPEESAVRPPTDDDEPPATRMSAPSSDPGPTLPPACRATRPASPIAASPVPSRTCPDPEVDASPLPSAMPPLDVPASAEASVIVPLESAPLPLLISRAPPRGPGPG